MKTMKVVDDEFVEALSDRERQKQQCGVCGVTKVQRAKGVCMVWYGMGQNRTRKLLDDDRRYLLMTGILCG